MDISWAELTADERAYKIFLTGKKDLCIMEFWYQGHYVSIHVEFRDEHAISVIKIESDNSVLKKFFEDSKDILLSLCNVRRHAWLDGFALGND